MKRTSFVTVIKLLLSNQTIDKNQNFHHDINSSLQASANLNAETPFLPEYSNSQSTANLTTRTPIQLSN